MKAMRLAALVAWTFCGAAVAAAQAPASIDDPVPGSVGKGDLVVDAVEFVRAPKTRDRYRDPVRLAGIPRDLGISDAYARVQYLLPIRDGSGRLVISDLRGILYVVDASGGGLTKYLDLRNAATDFAEDVFPNESGLLGFAFHPDFAKPGRPGYGKFYTGYSTHSDSGVADYLDDDSGSHEDVIREWTADRPEANVFSGTSREVFRVGQFAQNHNVGTLAFNPYAREGSADYGMLYACLGDGGGANDPREYGQGLSDPLASIIRIDPLAGSGDSGYGTPADNPFVGRAGVAPEVWAYGLRHAQQFSFDVDGRMFINDIGQDQVEEVNLGVAGGNYGWRLREGMHATAFGIEGGLQGRVYPNPGGDDFVYPIAQYDRDDGNAIAGGFVYRGTAIPELAGHYVFADIVRGRVFYFDATDVQPGRPAEVRELRIRVNGEEGALLATAGHENTYAPGTLRADLRMGIDAAGELYLLTKGDGWVRKLVPASG